MASLMNWDDVRFALAVVRAGSLLRAARSMQVEHTTVGRRIEALEHALGLKLFTRSRLGYELTREGEQLLPSLLDVERSAFAVARNALAEDQSLHGTVRITSPETFGACYVAPTLSALSPEHPHLTLELVTGGDVLDLARREADLALRFFRSKHADLVVRKLGILRHGLYASQSYLRARPFRNRDFRKHTLLASRREPGAIEAEWLHDVTQGQSPALITNMTVALLEASRMGAGIAVLPRYLGDRDPQLVHLPMPNEPEETLWLTVHRDVKSNRRVRTVIEFLAQRIASDAKLLLGR
jgi:DNA-binding transcriptional LysR family regulator